jgi:acyl-CoA synthetase (AMP-forming)/AMP-acid ligase II
MPVDHISAYAEAKPDQPALIQDGLILTWADYALRRAHIASALEFAGVAVGDTVALYEVNSVDYFVILSAIQRLGATAVQVNWRLTAEELAYVLENSDASAVIVNDEFLPVVDRVVDRSTIRRWIIVGDDRRPWADNLGQLLDQIRELPVVERANAPGATMIYTGGTTGKPKGVKRDAFSPESVDPAVIEAMTAWMRTMKLDLAHTHLVTAALYHQGPIGYANMALAAGGTVVVMRKYEPEEALRLIEKFKCTSTFMPPVVAKRLLDLPAEVRQKYDVSSLEVFVVTAGPVPQKLKEDILDAFGPVYFEAYSSTETATCATALTPQDVRRRPGSCGRVVAGTPFSIRDESGTLLPVGQRGLICCPNHRGAFVGYHKDPELSKEVIFDEFLTVGDIGYLDEDGFLYIVDRGRDMIISGGTNIYSAEIENVLHAHPAIADVAVFGVPDEAWGERVHAAVQLKPGRRLELTELQDFARQRLAGYKVPREMSVHAQFPRDAAGKLTKKPLREPFWRSTPASH